MHKHISLFLVAMAISATAQDGPGARPSELDQLGFLAGRWTLTMKAQTPDGGSESATGTMEGKWMLGKRHLQCLQSQKLMGIDMEGALMFSWDETKDQFVSTWFDSMSGRPMTGHGVMKDGTLTTTTEAYDMGEEMGKMRVRMTLKKKSNDAFSMQVFGGDEGKWMPFFEAEYARKK